MRAAHALTALLVATLVGAPVAGRLCLLACDAEAGRTVTEDPAPGAHCPGHEKSPAGANASRAPERPTHAPCADHGHSADDCLVAVGKPAGGTSSKRPVSTGLFVLPAASFLAGFSFDIAAGGLPAASPPRARPPLSAVLRL